MTDNREIILISVILAAVFFTGLFGFCYSQQKKVDVAAEESMFEVVDFQNTPVVSIVVVYHKKTKVMYMMPKHGSVATVMVDADGKPLLYEP